MKPFSLAALITLTLLLVWGCSLEPRYKRPKMSIPNTYKEDALWKIAQPSFANAYTQRWWLVYDDPILNQLEDELNAANQDIKIALAQYEGALAALKIARSAYFPTLNADAHALRIQTSKTIANPGIVNHYNDFLLGTDLSYEIDLWGKVRNSVKASRKTAQASRDDLAAVQLSLQASLATTYFSYRGTEANIRILTQLQYAYEKALELTRNRYNGGITPEADVDQAVTQLENVKTMLLDAKLNLAQQEHAMAILVGKAPAAFSIAPSKQQSKVVPVAPTLPSTLLERRPDIAAAEKRVQAANATIGVARAAFFPNFNLMGTVLGFESALIGSLLKAPSLYWAVGPSATMMLFDGGNLEGQLDQSYASYCQSVATYRKTVLNALQEVEDNLAAQRYLEKESVTQANATIAADKALQQANYRYEGGIATYLDVVIEQNTSLIAHLALIDIHTRRQVASVQLIKALGGGWEAATVLGFRN